MTVEARLPILFEDEAVVVVDKPAGLPSVPVPGRAGKSAKSELAASHPGIRAVHRLDQETSGVLLFARDGAAEKAMIEQFRARQVEKLYWALVRGCPKPTQGEIRHPIAERGDQAKLDRRGQEAFTRYRLLERLGEVSWVEARPLTGRYNQIRLHFISIGHPLVGERKYALGKDSPVRFRRVALHSRRIAFLSPATSAKVQIHAPMPKDLNDLIESLRSQKR